MCIDHCVGTTPNKHCSMALIDSFHWLNGSIFTGFTYGVSCIAATKMAKTPIQIDQHTNTIRQTRSQPAAFPVLGSATGPASTPASIPIFCFYCASFFYAVLLYLAGCFWSCYCANLVT